MCKTGCILRTCSILLLTLAAVSSAQYSGGFGTRGEPYQIGRVSDWQALMNTPADWNKHFILTTDLDCFEVAMSPVGTYAQHFTGVFYGDSHIIRNAVVNIPSNDYNGLFGYVGQNGHIANLGVENVTVKGKSFVGGLAGYCDHGSIVGCYATGSVEGDGAVGGLLGYNLSADLTACYATASVICNGDYAGGLAGYNLGNLTSCYATGSASGNVSVGGLLGFNGSSTRIDVCYATGRVAGNERVGGLIGENRGMLVFCYAAGLVSGNSYAGGLVGKDRLGYYHACFWDTDASNQSRSAGGTDKTTDEMKTLSTFIAAGWDFTDEDGDPADWTITDNNYPDLPFKHWVWTGIPDVVGMSWLEASATITDAGFFVGSVNWTVSETAPVGHIVMQYPAGGHKGAQGVFAIDVSISGETAFSAGNGTSADPYQIKTLSEWMLLTRSPEFWGKHFMLTADIDLRWMALSPIGSNNQNFTGVLDGNGHIISNAVLEMPYSEYVGLFGYLGRGSNSEVKNLGLQDVSIIGRNYVGGLAGCLGRGSVRACYVTGNVTGKELVGGLVGRNDFGSITHCYSTSAVSGDERVGGLAGDNAGMIRTSYAAGLVSGNSDLGGLIGYVYSANTGSAIACFWDMDGSGQLTSADGEGRNAEQMKDVETYENADWDFTVRDHNPADWVMPEDDYPHLAWEYWRIAEVPDVNGMEFEQAATTVKSAGFLLGSLKGIVNESVPVGYVVEQSPPPGSDGVEGIMTVDMVISYRSEFSNGSGTQEDPYRIGAVHEWILLADRAEFWDRHSVMTADIDFFGGRISPVGGFAGVFNGCDHVIRNAVVNMSENIFVGLFGDLDPNGHIHSTGVEDVYIVSTHDYGAVGGLVGFNRGDVNNCYVSGRIEGIQAVGGLVGSNKGSITACYTTGVVWGVHVVGGLVGSNNNKGIITESYATADVREVPYEGGGLVGHNDGGIIDCYARGEVHASVFAGGLVGRNMNIITGCFATGRVSRGSVAGGLVGRDDSGAITACFWNKDALGKTGGVGGEGKTLAEMRDPNTFISAGWDFIGEIANGTEDTWSICEGTNYPRLVWQIPDGDLLCPDGADFVDYSLLVSRWTDHNCADSNDCDGADLDQSGEIDINDLTILLGNWLEGIDTLMPPLPGLASDPYPADSAVDIPSDTFLKWRPSAYATLHDVYFGTESPGLFRGRQSQPAFAPGTLLRDMIYYWRIDEINPAGTATGAVWSFRTTTTPDPASNPDPHDGAVSVSIDPVLTWEAGSGTTSHDVYFGPISPGTFQGNQTEPTFRPGGLGNTGTYYWRVDEVNADGTTTGPVWSFTTADDNGGR